MRKTDLQKQGYHGEDVYYRDKETYLPMTEEIKEAVDQEKFNL